MLALQALCCYETGGDSFAERVGLLLRDPEVLADVGVDSPAPVELLEFARRLAVGAWDRHAQSDALIEQTAAHWSLARLTPVDRNVLRLGIFELLHLGETPGAVVINEAIELARCFGDKQSPAFVNGLLDAIWRKSQMPESNTPGSAEV